LRTSQLVESRPMPTSVPKTVQRTIADSATFSEFYSPANSA